MSSSVPAGRGPTGSPSGHLRRLPSLLGPLSSLPVPAPGSHELMQALLSQGREAGGWGGVEALPLARRLDSSKA